VIPLLILTREYELGYWDASGRGQGSPFIARWDERESFDQTDLTYGFDALVVEEVSRSRRQTGSGGASRHIFVAFRAHLRHGVF
jgi:hypothetical protein